MTVGQRLATWWDRRRAVRDAYRAGYGSRPGQCCPYRDPARRLAWGRGREDCKTHAFLDAW